LSEQPGGSSTTYRGHEPTFSGKTDSDHPIRAGAIQGLQQLFKNSPDLRSLLRVVNRAEGTGGHAVSISWRVLVVSMSSWMEMSAVEKGMGLNGR